MKLKTFIPKLLLWIPQSFLFSFPVLCFHPLCSLPPSSSCCQWVQAESKAPYLLTAFTFMIPIGNGIQLVWITMLLGHDQSTTSALHSPLTLSMSGKLFTSREEVQSNKSSWKMGEVKKEQTLQSCVAFINGMYEFVKSLAGCIFRTVCDTEKCTWN